MTLNKPEQPETNSMSIYLSLNSALSVANWIAPTDVAAITLARRIAMALDTAFDMGDLKEATPLAAKYLQVLQQLHLTVETRTQGKQGEQNDGTNHVGDYLRLINTTDTKQKPKPAQRGASGGSSRR
tara:strand:- start:887 stop:1267 length:381 start_codon:yes stop_codon:yes gene_type:complete